MAEINCDVLGIFENGSHSVFLKFDKGEIGLPSVKLTVEYEDKEKQLKKYNTCHAFEQEVKKEGKVRHADSSLLSAHEKYACLSPDPALTARLSKRMRGFSRGVDTKTVTPPSDDHKEPRQERPTTPAPSLPHPVPKLAVPSKLTDAFADPEDDSPRDALGKASTGLDLPRDKPGLDVPDDAHVRGRKKSSTSPRQHNRRDGDERDEQSPEARIGLRPAISRKERAILKVDVDERRHTRGGLRTQSEGMELERDEDRDDKCRDDEAPSALLVKEESRTHIERLPEKLVLIRSGRRDSTPITFNRSKQDRIASHQDLLFKSLEDEKTIKTLVEYANAHEKGNDIMESLVKIFHEKLSSLDYINKLVDLELSSGGKTTTLFRGNTFYTASVVYYMKILGKKYLNKALGGIIHSLLQPGKKVEVLSCEINPSKLSDIVDQKKLQKRIEKNTSNLLNYCEQILTSIKYSNSYFPQSFRKLFHSIREKIRLRYPGDAAVLTTGPSGFLWLRYLCAAIISPKVFGLVDYDVPPEKMRDLTLIVKVLQNLANLIEFGQKEQFMVVCNPWIICRKQDMIQVIDQLCALNEKVRKATEIFDHEDLFSYYVKLTAYCNTNAVDLQKSGEPAIAKLIECSLNFTASNGVT